MINRAERMNAIMNGLLTRLNIPVNPKEGGIQQALEVHFLMEMMDVIQQNIHFVTINRIESILMELVITTTEINNLSDEIMAEQSNQSK